MAAMLDEQPKITRYSRRMAGARLEASLYLMTFPNGKSYVGITKRPNVRLREHRKRAATGAAQAIYQAWRKHGEPTMQIIGKATNYETAFAMEVALIERMGTKAPNGYNMTDGGDALNGLERSPEWNAKVAKHNRLRAADPAVREAARQSILKRWEDPAYRAKVNAAREARQAELRSDPEWRARRAAKCAEAMRRKWNDPDYLAKMAARKPPVIPIDLRKQAAAKRLATMGSAGLSAAVRKSWVRRKTSQLES